jgi:hypothetical protein
MDEARWRATQDLSAMLEFLGAGASRRKLRLFAVACARYVEARRWLFDERGFAAVVVAERFADGLASAQDMERAHGLARSRVVVWPERGHRPGVREAAAASARDAARNLCGLVIDVAGDRVGWNRLDSAVVAARHAEVTAWMCRLIRDLFGNPFRPVFVDPLWTVRHDHAAGRLAADIYEGRTFEHLPILADALEDAGCSDPVVLDHCRQPAEHVRGCWLLDRLLGKE